jgi:hypothetical protein
VSTLDIPPWSDEVQKKISALDWSRMKQGVEERTSAAEQLGWLKMYVEVNGLHQRFDETADGLAEILQKRMNALNAVDEESIRADEYRAFQADRSGDPEFEFSKREVAAELQGMISSVLAVTRLREVKALKAFTRVVPPADWKDREASPFAPISREPHNWLPAVEVKGEGIFVELAREEILRWEKIFSKVKVDGGDLSIAEKVNANYIADWNRRFGDDAGPPPKVITPRFLLVHSFAHALVHSLTIESGYSGSSIRERLYISDGDKPMAGVLIYTATPDADGTLGGLCRQAEPDRFVELVRDGIKHLEWCSSDPLCIDGAMTQSEPLNHAACHACMLVSETSCEEFNRLLDRTTLVGTPADRSLGYFSPVLDL